MWNASNMCASINTLITDWLTTSQQQGESMGVQRRQVGEGTSSHQYCLELFINGYCHQWECCELHDFELSAQGHRSHCDQHGHGCTGFCVLSKFQSLYTPTDSSEFAKLRLYVGHKHKRWMDSSTWQACLGTRLSVTGQKADCWQYLLCTDSLPQ